MNFVKVFVYGPLIEGGYDNSSLPVGCKMIRPLIINTKMYLTPYGYPVITLEEGRSKGYLYEIPYESLGDLDQIEGFYGDISKDLTTRKSIKLKGELIYTYIASEILLKIIKENELIIGNGDWLKFYNNHWKQFEDQTVVEISGSFDQADILEICNSFEVDSIEEVHSLLESSFRYNIMLEAFDSKSKKQASDDKKINELDLLDEESPEETQSLDDLNEPEVSPDTLDKMPEEEPASTAPVKEPSLSDLEEPADVPEKQPTDAVTTSAPPQPINIPSTDELPPEEKKEEPKVANSWKSEKHLRVLYNNFFKLFPKKSNVNVKFTSVKADSLHPESKYLQANITSICESEKNKGKYYNQWMQLRRQRTTQKWSMDLPCEVRCNCKSFIYSLAYANMRNKSLAGLATKNGKLGGHRINYNIPSNETNPNYTPALCKHLMSLTTQIFDTNSGLVKKSNVV